MPYERILLTKVRKKVGVVLRFDQLTTPMAFETASAPGQTSTSNRRLERPTKFVGSFEDSSN